MTGSALAQYSTDHLVAAIREVCSQANPADPEMVTQREFDRVRGEAGVQCPRASHLVTRFNSPWPDLLKTANRKKGAYHALRHRELGYEPARADRKTCVAAIRRAAARFGQRTLLPKEYEQERSNALDGSQGVTRERLEALWPVASQLQKFGWSELLKEGDLDETEMAPPWGIEPDEIMEIFLKCRGYVPMMKELRRFASTHAIAVTGREMKTDQVFRELVEGREKSGVWTPPRPLIERWAPKPVPDGLAMEKETVKAVRESYPIRPRHHWTDERILEGLDDAIRKLQPGEALTQIVLRRLARENPGAVPSPGTVTTYAGKNDTNLAELREQALKRVMRSGHEAA